MNDKQNQALAKKSGNDIMGIPYNSMSELVSIIDGFVKGKHLGATTSADALSVYLKSRELGIGFGMACDHMHIVNSKTGIDIHIVRALMSKAGIVSTLVRNYEPLYEYIAGSGAKYREDTLPKHAEVVYSKEDAERAIAGNKLPVSVSTNKDGYPIIVDRVTEYLFERWIIDSNGKQVLIKEPGRFTFSEANNAKLTTNNNGEIDPNSAWTKYPKVMLDTRAFTYGARRIASDILLGCYESTELYNIENVEYVVDNNGDIIDAPHTEVK